MLNTKLTELRKSRPGHITLQDVEAFFHRRSYRRGWRSIGQFERGEIKSPPDRFISLYAQRLEVGERTVRLALAVTQRQRERRVGPFARKRAA